MFLAATMFAALSPAHAAGKPFRIQVVDDATGRGIPLVEAETTAGQLFVTDSAGLIAFAEPGQMQGEVYLQLRSHGYEFAPDGFGFRGARVSPRPGGSAQIKARRVSIAERLCRLTGLGIYRDSVLLGEKPPLALPLVSGGVAGQDSTCAVPYRGRLFWLWGDTNRLAYPLGNFRTSCAWSDLPGKGGLPIAQGVDYRYFTGPDGFCREMCPLERKPGVVWLSGLTTVRDEAGAERLVAHYSRREGMKQLYEHGLALFNDATEIFEAATSLPIEPEEWRILEGHPTPVRQGETDYLYFGLAVPQMRVPARLAEVRNPASYEAWTCAGPDGRPRRVNGKLDYAWRRDTPPVEPEREMEWLRKKLISPDECLVSPVEKATGRRVRLHRGSVHWNPFRQRWVLIATEFGGESSVIGEIWYAEAQEPTGPWRHAVKVITHDRYSFYNPVHHPFFDEDGGRLIYFEGTYTHTFANRPDRTPLYDYNQVLYRLDLADPRLIPAQE